MFSSSNNPVVVGRLELATTLVSALLSGNRGSVVVKTEDDATSVDCWMSSVTWSIDAIMDVDRQASIYNKSGLYHG